jgi:hypothetical protein
VLAFLTEHGWRPDPRSGLALWQLWQRLAAAQTMQLHHLLEFKRGETDVPQTQTAG